MLCSDWSLHIVYNSVDHGGWFDSNTVEITIAENNSTKFCDLSCLHCQFRRTEIYVGFYLILTMMSQFYNNWRSKACLYANYLAGKLRYKQK